MSENKNKKLEIFDSEIDDRNFSGELKEGSSFHTSESLYNELINHKKKRKKKKKKLYRGKRKRKNRLKDRVETVEKPNIAKDVKTSKISYDFNREERIKKKAFEEFEKTRKQQVKNTITKLKREAREGTGLKSNNVFANSKVLNNTSLKKNSNILNKNKLNINEKNVGNNFDNFNVEQEKRRIKEDKKREERLLKE